MSEAAGQIDDADNKTIEAIQADDSEQVRATLSWALDATGQRFMSYLLACEAEAIQSLTTGEAKPTPPQLEVGRTLAALKANIPAELDASNSAEVLRNWLCQVMPEHPVMIMLRQHIKPLEDVPVSEDELENALAILARDVFPALLLPNAPDEFKVPFMERNIRATMLIFRLPSVKKFESAALVDKKLKKVFAKESPHSGRTAWVARKTGSGSTVQLSMVPETLLLSAWKQVRDSDPSQSAFVEAALRELGLMRKLLDGQSCTIPAKVAFAGVLLPPDATLRVPNGVVRSVTETDRENAPESLKHQLSGTDSSGATTVINYDGDIVLEYDYPYAVRAVPWTSGDDPKWPEEFKLPDQGLEGTILRLRFSLMLAVQRPDYKAQLVPTWRAYTEPFSQGGGMSWYDPRQGTGMMPTQLTDEEVTAWGEWFDRLSAAPVEKIELALSRILKAIAERREPSDVLVDSVIAWENLFGTKDGEPVFRVTTCLAVLLEHSLEARKSLKRELGKIYTLRSDVVHGNKNLSPGDYPKCQDALDIGIRAVRTLATTRIDILALPNGAERSAELLMGNAVDESETDK